MVSGHSASQRLFKFLKIYIILLTLRKIIKVLINKNQTEKLGITIVGFDIKLTTVAHIQIKTSPILDTVPGVNVVHVRCRPLRMYALYFERYMTGNFAIRSF